MLFRREGKLDLFEVKSGQSFDESFASNMIKFEKMFPDMASGNKTVVYSGDSIPQFKGCRYENYKTVSQMFSEDAQPFMFSIKT